MTLEWRGRTLVITWLPVASMGRLAACAPQTAAETEVLAALLAGAIFLFSGLYAPGPERAGVLLPQRSAAYVTRLSRDLGRSAPGISGQAEAVKPTPLLDAVQEKIAAAEPAANSLLDRNHLFIQLYGAAQRLTQRQVVDDADPRYSVSRTTE